MQEFVDEGTVEIDAVFEPAPPGQIVHEGDASIPEVKVVVESNGGLVEDDVTTYLDRDLTIGLGRAAAGPVVEIGVSDPSAMTNAELTLPYEDEALVLGDEGDLRIAWYDEEIQLWMPLQGEMIVDPVANTVTTEVEHFSSYAVTQGLNQGGDGAWVWDQSVINEFFGPVAVACIGSDDSVSAEVMFAIDNSASMDDNDPGDLRVGAATDFLNQMFASDKAGVVTFGNPPIRRSALRLLDSAGRAAVRDAIAVSGTTVPSGTDISGAISRSVDSLLTGGNGRNAQLIILLTDGEQSVTDYDPGAAQRAINHQIPIYTVGLGSGPNATLLSDIASSTGGQYFPASDAGALAEIYDELAGDLIDDGTDTDGDGFTDCEETNGLFTPWRGFHSEGNRHLTDVEHAAFIRTNPNLPDSDFDQSDDNEELARVPIGLNPEVARAYKPLIDLGVTEYFLMVRGDPTTSDTDDDGLRDPVAPRFREACGDRTDLQSPSPFKADSDGDLRSDLAECLDGTDPLLIQEATSNGVEGLSITTVLTPIRYFEDGSPNPPVRFRFWRNNASPRRVFLDNSIYYDDNFNCVRGGCEIFDDFAQNNADCGFFQARCETDEEQIRKKIKQIVQDQNIFDTSNGDLSTEYVALDSTTFCAWFYEGCDFDDIRSEVENVDRDKLTIPFLASIRPFTLSRQLETGKIVPVPNLAPVAATELYRVYRNANRTAEERNAAVNNGITRCKASATAVSVLAFNDFSHPCENISIFLPSEADTGQAAVVVANHVTRRRPSDHVLQFRTGALTDAIVTQEMINRGLSSSKPSEWYTRFPVCNTAARNQWNTDNPGQTAACQEYPYRSSTKSGPGNGTSTNNPRASIQLVETGGNSREGTAYGAFVGCPGIKNPAAPGQSGDKFVVIPMIGEDAPPTDFVCSP